MHEDNNDIFEGYIRSGSSPQTDKFNVILIKISRTIL